MSGPADLRSGDLLTVQQALAILPVGRTLIYELIRDGQLPAIRVRASGSRRGRLLVHRADLEALVARARDGATVAPVSPDIDAIRARVGRQFARNEGGRGGPAET